MAGVAKKKQSLPKGRHLSQIKRQRQNLKRHARNVQIKSSLKTAMKKVVTAAAEKNAESAQQSLRAASQFIQKAVSKGILHKQNAARRISRLAHLVNSIS